ncbi:MAG: iditol 2-dehydrogenase [Hyphomicrobiales bacterium]|nr:MAG: iditol 2-dehydrogenase [Hyphomicrobiales bacterium]
MLGAVLLGDRKVGLRNFEEPEPGPDEVVVAVKASGLCGSDLHQYRAPSAERTTLEPLCIAGHEPAGVVHAVGSGVSPRIAQVGDRVMVHHYGSCGMCEYCRSGWTQMCSKMEMRLYGTNEHGAHAPYMKVPAATLIPLDESLSFEAGAAIGCGTGTAWGGLNRLGDVGGATIAVFGQGPVGASATMLAAARGATVIALDIDDSRLKKARDFGAAETVNPTEVDAAAAIRELTAGRGAQLALETSGATVAAASALASLAPWGKLCLVGLGGRLEFDVLAYLRSQMTIMTSWSMSNVDQERCASFVARHSLPVDDLFSHRWDLEDAVAAYAEFDRQSAGKGVFVF